MGDDQGAASGRDSVSVVLSTAPEAEAPGLADQLLERRLVACVNLIGPVESRYRWEGKVETASETLLLMKTSRPDDLRATLVELHSYDVPEFLVLPVDSGHAGYLEWVLSSCRPNSP